MTRSFATLIAVGFLSVSRIETSYADSNHDDDKHEQKYDTDRQHDEHSSSFESQPDSPSGNPISQNLDALSNSVNKAANKINQAKEWWQFW